jgi:hypothetical protein
MFDNGVRPLIVNHLYVYPPVQDKKLPTDTALIEYFSNSKKQILAYFEDDYKSISPMSQTQFVTGEIIFDKTGEVKELKEIAKAQMSKKYVDVNTEVSDLGLYAIWDSIDDLESMYEDDLAVGLTLKKRK